MDKGIGNPWENYFIEVPDNVVQMINTFWQDDNAASGKLINPWMLNQRWNRPDLQFCSFTWKNLPGSPGHPSDSIEREWAELSYYFGALSLPAASMEILAHPKIVNFDGGQAGIDEHSAFVNNPFYDVWGFWEYIAEKLNEQP